MSVNLETALNNVNKFINIDGNRQPFAHHFDKLRNALFAKLREDSIFDKFFNGHSLQGSYGDNLKVTLPDEFDSVFILKLPFHDQAIIKEDVYVAGNVHIDLTEIFKKIDNQIQYADVLKKLKELVTPANLLMVEKVQSWLQGCFKKALDQLENRINVNNAFSSLSYHKTGPAHCIKVTGPYKYSVDFVPGFIFEEKQNVVKNVQGYWHAIPKPAKPYDFYSISFRASYFDQERIIMGNNKNLKNVLRMMKKFRDSKTNMANLKSYYIKTVFLWKTKNTQNTFWSSPLNKIVVQMFHELEQTLINKELPFFWNKHCNMYATFNNKQIQDMSNCVGFAKRVLMQAQNTERLDEMLLSRTFEVFLTKSERESVPSICRCIILSMQQLVINVQPKQQANQQQQQQQQQAKQKQEQQAKQQPLQQQQQQAKQKQEQLAKQQQQQQQAKQKQEQQAKQQQLQQQQQKAKQKQEQQAKQQQLQQQQQQQAKQKQQQQQQTKQKQQPAPPRQQPINQEQQQQQKENTSNVQINIENKTGCVLS